VAEFTLLPVTGCPKGQLLVGFLGTRDEKEKGQHPIKRIFRIEQWFHT
jgi:hypothetical protein